MKYLVLEYLPHTMDGFDTATVRIDGHYDAREWAGAHARLWAEKPMHTESRIVVVEVVSEIKRPRHWPEATS